MAFDDKPAANQLTKGRLEETPNHTVIQRISRPKELILLFWSSETNAASILLTDSEMFKAAARTREKNIKKSPWYIETIHKVHCLPMRAVHDIGTRVYELLNDYGGYTKARIREIGVFSHCGIDGPITYHSVVYPPIDPESNTNQMSLVGWSNINFNWIKEGALCVFYGSKSAAENDSFAEKISNLNNFKNVTVWGQKKFSYPSYFPNYRVANSARLAGFDWSSYETYLVGGNTGQSWQSMNISIKSVEKLTPEELSKFPPALPMQSYKNGMQLVCATQGVFNDHRANT